MPQNYHPVSQIPLFVAGFSGRVGVELTPRLAPSLPPPRAHAHADRTARVVYNERAPGPCRAATRRSTVARCQQSIKRIAERLLFSLDAVAIHSPVSRRTGTFFYSAGGDCEPAAHAGGLVSGPSPLLLKSMRRRCLPGTGSVCYAVDGKSSEFQLDLAAAAAVAAEATSAVRARRIEGGFEVRRLLRQLCCCIMSVSYRQFFLFCFSTCVAAYVSCKQLCPARYKVSQQTLAARNRCS